MRANTILYRLLIVSAAFWLAGCAATAARSAAPAPVVDHSAAAALSQPSATAAATTPPPSPTAEVPIVKVKPLPRQLPLESEPQISMAPPTPKPQPRKPPTAPTGLAGAPASVAATPTAAAPIAAAAPTPVTSVTTPTAPPSAPPPENKPAAVTPPPRPTAAVRDITPPPADLEPKKGNQAVQVLLDSARKHVVGSNWDKAGADLERALRIEPKNAGIWHDLAQIRLQQRQFKQAEDLAAKSNSLAGNDANVRSRNYKVISVARRALGDDRGADTAEAQAAANKPQ